MPRSARGSGGGRRRAGGSTRGLRDPGLHAATAARGSNSSSALSRSGRRRGGAGPRPRLAHDARGEGPAAHGPGAGHPAPRGAGLRVVEREPARRGAGRRRHGLPSGHRPCRHVRRAAHRRDGGGRRQRGAREAPPVRARRQARPLPGPHVLVAQHQHLPRSPVGARSGDLRRRPVSHRPDRRRVREGAAGRRPEVLSRDRHREALRRPQRARARPPHVRRQAERARPVGHLPAGVPRSRAGRAAWPP